ncbi:MAG: Kelch repeat-containing protein [Micromonosporaceae bacterium]
MRTHSVLHTGTRLLAPVAFGVILAVTAVGCGSTPSPISTPSPTSNTGTASPPAASPRTTPPSPTTATWKLLPPAPVTKMEPQYVVSVWTGSQMLIRGSVRTGESSKPVTLGYTPATGTWRTLAPGPAPRTLQGDDSAVWTGHEMLVFGLTSAAYNPVTNTWRPITFNMFAALGSVRVWTGRQAIFWGGGCCGGALDKGAVYTPATGSWRTLPPSPLGARYTSGAWTGTELIIAGGSRPPTGGDSHSHTFADAAAYNPATNMWRKLPAMPEARSDGTMIWDGTEVLYLAGTRAGARAPSADGVAFNPSTGRWRRLPRMEVNRAGFAAVWTGHEVLVWGGWTGSFPSHLIPPHGVAYDPAVNRWSAMPMAPLRGRGEPTAVWTGSQMIVWGGLTRGELKDTFLNDGAAFRPAA